MLSHLSRTLSGALARLLNQIRFTALFPAGLLVGFVAIAMSAIGFAQPALEGPILVGVLGVWLTASLVLSAAAHTMIRFREGYRDTRFGVYTTHARTNRELQRLEGLKEQHRKHLRGALQEAFEEGKRWYDDGSEICSSDALDLFRLTSPPKHPGAYWSEVVGPDNRTRREQIEDGWSHDVSPTVMHTLRSIKAQLRRFPDRNRLLPTRTGNTLRASEDRATSTLRAAGVVGAPQGFVSSFQRLENDIPESLRSEYDSSRSNVDMLCIFAAVASTCLGLTGLILVASALVDEPRTVQQLLIGDDANGTKTNTRPLLWLGGALGVFRFYLRFAVRRSVETYADLLEVIADAIVAAHKVPTPPPSPSPPLIVAPIAFARSRRNRHIAVR